jgi:voltage-gated potassium channel
VSSFEHPLTRPDGFVGILGIMAGKHEDRVARWEHVTAYPLTALSVLFIVVYAWPILDPAMEPHLRRICEIGDLAIWGLFGVDYLVRFSLARQKRVFVHTHWFDLAVLLLPMLRPLRALRLITAIKVLNRRAADLTRGRLAVYVGATTVLLVVVGALGVLEAERGRPGSNIETFPEALWWGVATITTAGYGDFYPTTLEGRLVAVALMIGGIGLIGFVTGSLATWIVERIATDEHPAERTQRDVALLLSEVRELRAEVAELRAGRTDTDGG